MAAASRLASIRFKAQRISRGECKQTLGPNLGEPHTKAFGDSLFELRLKGAEGIARVFYCTLIGRRIVMLHSFVKKSSKTPRHDLDLAHSRLKEIKHAHS